METDGPRHWTRWQLTKSPKQGLVLSALFLALAVVGWLSVAMDPDPLVIVMAVGWSLLGMGHLASALALKARQSKVEADGGN